MPYIHNNLQVQTTATQIINLPVSVGQSRAVQIYNGHSSAIFVGDKNITTSGATIGRTIAASGSLQLWLNGGDQVYAISAAQTAAGAVVVSYSA